MVETVSYQAVRMTGIKTGQPSPVVLKSGEYSIQTVTHHAAPCDGCGSVALIHEDDLKATWTCPTCKRSSTRKGSDKVPVCKGHTVKGQKIAHDPVEMTSEDPEPGRACHMTPRCKGKHRRTD